MSKIQDIIKNIWKAGTMEDANVIEGLNTLPQDTVNKIIDVYFYLINWDLESFSEKSDIKWNDLKSVRSSTNKSHIDIIKEVLASFYLSEHRLDEYVQGGPKLRQAVLANFSKEWGVDQELLVKIYINWVGLKKYFGC